MAGVSNTSVVPLVTSLLVLAIVTVVVVVALTVIAITRDRCRNRWQLLTMLMRITRAGTMKTAPENRVQQHRRDGEKLACEVHAENP